MIFAKGDIIKDKEILNQKKQDLMKLFDTLKIDLKNDKAFAILGRMRKFDNGQAGILDLFEEYNNAYKSLSDEEKEVKCDKIYKTFKERFDPHKYTFNDAMSRVDGIKEKYTFGIKESYAFGIGLLIPKGIIIIDADDEESSKAILKLVEEKNIDTPIIKTNKGYHFYFKNDTVTSHSPRALTQLGVRIDYRNHGNGNNYIVLPYKENYRKVFNNNGIVAELPKELFPVEEKKSNTKKAKTNKTASAEPIQAFEEGSRNDSLFKYLCKFATDINLRTYENLLPLGIGANALKCNPPLTTEEVETIVKNVINNYTLPSYMSNNNKIIAYNLAETIVADYNCISDKMNSYIYNGKYYEEVLIDYYKIIDGYIHDKLLMTTRLVKEVTGHIYNQSNKGAVENSRNYINFKNGLFNIKTRKLEPHSSEVITLGVINGEYDPKKSDITGTNFERFLNTSLDDELIPVVQEMLGVCLYPLTDRIHYFYTLVGEGRNGKGVLLEIILAIISENLRSGISMADYDARFKNSSIKGKQINICMDDPTTRLESIGGLKSVTAGEGIFCEKKGVDGELIKAILTHISAFNALPSLQEKTNALFDRMILIPFEKTFGTEEEVQKGEKDAIRDVNLKTNIINHELDIVINWALEGLLRIIDNNYNFTTAKAIEKAKMKYRRDVDSVKAWLDTEMEVIKEPKYADYKNTKVLYTIYTNYCKDIRIEGVRYPAFKQGLERHLKHIRGAHKIKQRYQCYAIRQVVFTDDIPVGEKAVPPVKEIAVKLDDMTEIPHDANCPF